MMKTNPKSILLLVSLIIISSCKEPREKISQRWVFTDLKTPLARAMTKAFDPAALQYDFAELNKKIQGNRLILNENGSCYGVLMNTYFKGEWVWSNVGPMVITHISFPKKLRLKWLLQKQSGNELVFEVDAENLLQLFQLERLKQDAQDSIQAANWLASQSGDWMITAEREKDKFGNSHPDPWSPGMNSWRIKPEHAESREELKKRVRNHLNFVYSFFDFICSGDRYWVSQDWFVSPIKTGNNGTALIGESRIPEQWYNCFYDSAQALKGYYMLKTAFHSDAVKIPGEDNSLLFNKLMLEQLLKAFDKEYK